MHAANRTHVPRADKILVDLPSEEKIKQRYDQNKERRENFERKENENNNSIRKTKTVQIDSQVASTSRMGCTSPVIEGRKRSLSEQSDHDDNKKSRRDGM